MSDLPEDAAPTPAAEFVLGTLEGADLAVALRRQATDPAFAEEIEFWEQSLMPMLALVQPVPPPANLWARIEASIAPPNAANNNALRWWQATALLGLATAAALALTLRLRPPTPPTMLAVLTPQTTGYPALLAIAGPNGTLLVRPTATVNVPTNHDLELWALPEGAKTPTPLGVLPAAGRLVTQPETQGTAILVSLEPKGGSPTGLPTGPVLYAGKLTRYE
jgi:anti-sigma-K factor RskA